MNETDRAFDGLEKPRSVPYRGPLVWIRPVTPALLGLDPMFDSLRSDRSFQNLLLRPVRKEAAQK